MRIKIKGDGTTRGTEVFDYLTDKKIPRITKLNIDFDVYGDYEGLVKATMILQPLEVEMEAYVDEIRIGDTIYKPVDKEVDKLRAMMKSEPLYLENLDD